MTEYYKPVSGKCSDCSGCTRYFGGQFGYCFILKSLLKSDDTPYVCPLKSAPTTEELIENYVDSWMDLIRLIA